MARLWDRLAGLIGHGDEPGAHAAENQDRLDAGQRLHRAGDYGGAERLYRQVLDGAPDNDRALFLLGLLAHQAGRAEQAVDLIAAAIQRNPRVAEYHNDLGSIYLSLQRGDEADAAFLAALQRDPMCGPAWVNRGILLQRRHADGEAWLCLRRAVCLIPESADAHVALASLHIEASRYGHALPPLRRAVTLVPSYAEARLNLGNVLRELGHRDAAIAQFTLTLRTRPEMTEAMLNLAHIGMPEQAARLLHGALVVRPDYSEAHNDLGVILYRQGRQNEARSSVDRCLVINPGDPAAIWGKFFFALPIIPKDAQEAKQAIVNFDRSLTAWRLTVLQSTMRTVAAEQIGRAQPFYLVYRRGNHRHRMSAYGDTISELAMGRWGASPIRLARGHRLKLAIVSHHVRRHSVWDMVLHGFLQELDRDRFSVTLFHTDSRTDDQTDLARTLVDQFHGSGIDFAPALRLLRADPPDVIFYPEIGMDTPTCKLAALRLAPLQATGWGQPMTSGLPTIDLYFSGALLEAPDADAHYREKLIRLPGTGVTTYPPTASMTGAIAASMNGDGDGGRCLNFVLCQNAFKFDPADDALYARIIEQTAPSKLWVLCNPRVQWNDLFLARLKEAFVRRRLDPATVIVSQPWVAYDAFPRFLDTMDVYLDSPAFSGYTTARQALYRGLPIVTLEGPYLRQRLAAGLMRQIGHTDTIANSVDDYVAIAVRLAGECRDREAGQARRHAIRAAAPRADYNRDAAHGFQRTLLDELGRRDQPI